MAGQRLMWPDPEAASVAPETHSRNRPIIKHPMKKINQPWKVFRKGIRH